MSTTVARLIHTSSPVGSTSFSVPSLIRDPGRGLEPRKRPDLLNDPADQVIRDRPEKVGAVKQHRNIVLVHSKASNRL